MFFVKEMFLLVCFILFVLVCFLVLFFLFFVVVACIISLQLTFSVFKLDVRVQHNFSHSDECPFKQKLEDAQARSGFSINGKFVLSYCWVEQCAVSTLGI